MIPLAGIGSNFEQGATMKAFGYIRVSTGKQAKEGQSLPAQGRSCAALCENKAYSLEMAWIDGNSAKDMKWKHPGDISRPPTPGDRRRPAFRTMIHEAIRRGDINVIVVSDFDRLSRNSRDLQNLRFWLAEIGIQIESASEPITFGTPMGEVQFGMKSVLSQWFRDVVAANTKRVLADIKAQGGKYGHVPFGFRAVPNPARSNGKVRYDLVADDAQQAALREMREMQKAGLSFGHIARALNYSLRRSPQSRHDANGKMAPCMWTRQSVRVVLGR